VIEELRKHFNPSTHPKIPKYSLLYIYTTIDAHAALHTPSHPSRNLSLALRRRLPGLQCPFQHPQTLQALRALLSPSLVSLWLVLPLLGLSYFPFLVFRTSLCLVFRYFPLLCCCFARFAPFATPTYPTTSIQLLPPYPIHTTPHTSPATKRSKFSNTYYPTAVEQDRFEERVSNSVFHDRLHARFIHSHHTNHTHLLLIRTDFYSHTRSIA
jgi:hypothetical protein